MKRTIVLFTTVTLLLLFPTISFASTTTKQISSGPVNPFSFSAAPGVAPGTIDITWFDDGMQTRTYNLFYGISPGDYIYAVPNIAHYNGQVNIFTVGSLNPNTTYYFRLDCISGGTYQTSGPIMAVSSSGSTQTTKALTSEPKTGANNSFFFSVTKGPISGTVNVNWYDNGTANKYDIVYGTSPYNSQYGVNGVYYKKNVDNTFTVSALAPGKTYYFSLVAERDSNVIFWSQPLSATAR
jgi:hypothetical protein